MGKWMIMLVSALLVLGLALLPGCGDDDDSSSDTDSDTDTDTDTDQNCNTCHGNPPSTGSHGDHSMNCNTCHTMVDSSGEIINQTAHTDGDPDIAPGGTGSCDTSTQTCTGMSCHGGGPITW